MRFPFVVLQLGLVLTALWWFRIEESTGLTLLLPWIFVGFIVHHLLPPRYRREFFLLLSFAAITIVLPFPHSVLLIATGLGFVGLCHLPVRFGVRVTLVVLAAAGLAAIQAGWIGGAGWAEFRIVVVPVLGAIFMFRLAVYLYALRHEEGHATLAERLGYFFLLPNVSFLLFPVVDYQTYRRTYYNASAENIYQKGILWILRGLTHLVLYRVIYMYVTPDPEEVRDLWTVAQFSITSYLLYLRISGQFHLIIGILCLFGFNLPETHHRYFLAAGFNDFWRRINIYWKDFMMQHIYFPAFVPLRRRLGMVPGLVLATIIVFLTTWLLHSYQWFWLRGSFPVTATDGVFWGFLGLMVVLNSLREAGRRRATNLLTWRTAAVRSCKTVSFFVLMSLLWSLWSSHSIDRWLNVVSNVRNGSALDAATLVMLLGVAILGGTVWQIVAHKPIELPRMLSLHRDGVQVTVVTTMLLLVSMPYARGLWGTGPKQFITTITRERLNVADQQIADRGYYEGLLDQRHFASALWSARRGIAPGDGVPFEDSVIAEKRNDLLEYQLKPMFRGTFKDAPFTTNQWRMRGKEVEFSKPSGTFRIALVGASYEMAGGVADDETAAAVLESRLNSDDVQSTQARFEVLNHSVGGYSMIHKGLVVEHDVGRFGPDLVLLTVYSTEEIRLLNHLVRVVEADTPIAYPELAAIIERSGAKPWMEVPQLREALRPYLPEVFAWSFQKIKADCEERGLRLEVVFLPTTTDADRSRAKARLHQLFNLAVSAGLTPVQIEDVYGEHEMSEVQLSMTDSHLNVLGNRLFADRILEALMNSELDTSP
jgi:D-alanyl-lipoteichoic acid acyltransferase DltB (MBOAT superfamily)